MSGDLWNRQLSEELWDKLRDTLNEMEEAGISVRFGSWQNSTTDWESVPFVVSNRTCNVEITWDRQGQRWKRGKRIEES